MSEMIGEFPALHQTIVAERDIYLTHTLRQATRCVEAPSNAESNYHTFSHNSPFDFFGKNTQDNGINNLIDFTFIFFLKKNSKQITLLGMKCD